MTDDATKARRVSENLQRLAQGIDAAIEAIAGERIAFTLVVFTPQSGNYISSASRQENVRELEHLLRMWREGKPDVPLHKIN